MAVQSIIQQECRGQNKNLHDAYEILNKHHAKYHLPTRNTWNLRKLTFSLNARYSRKTETVALITLAV